MNNSFSNPAGSQHFGKDETNQAKFKERVGVLLVHGIGQQQKFDHLQEIARNIAITLKTDSLFSSSLQSEIKYVVENETQSANEAPVIISIKDALDAVTELHFHEVWWADLGEPTTLKTVLSFWIWGLSLWTNPGYFKNLLIDENPTKTRLPQENGKTVSTVSLMGRIELFLISLMAVIIMPVLAALNRILGILGIYVSLDIVSQYLSRVKIFQQQSRNSSSPLSNLNEPPRYGIRRRMIKALINVALQGYDRWYILAHSQGSVVAFNGLMEIDQLLPRYIDEALWETAECKGFTGKETNLEKWLKGLAKPEKPFWLESGSFINRQKLFSGLRGFMTYGSPLSKIAVLWPALVQLNKDEKIFSSDFEWINIYDPMDPVAGKTHYFDPESKDSLNLKPQDIPYKANGLHLASHLGYLNPDSKRNDKLVNSVTAWLLYGHKFKLDSVLNKRQARYRDLSRVIGWWAIGFLIALIPSVLEIVTLPIRFFLGDISSFGINWFSILSNSARILLVGAFFGIVIVLIIGLVSFIVEKIQVRNLDIVMDTIHEYLREKANHKLSREELLKVFNFYKRKTVNRAVEKLVEKNLIACLGNSYCIPTLRIKAVETLQAKLDKYTRKKRIDICRGILQKLTLNPKVHTKDHLQLTFGRAEECLWVLEWENVLIFHTLRQEGNEPLLVIIEIINQETTETGEVSNEQNLNDKISLIVQNDKTFLTRLERVATDFNTRTGVPAEQFTSEAG